jgi:hypothetical protein
LISVSAASARWRRASSSSTVPQRSIAV